MPFHSQMMNEASGFTHTQIKFKLNILNCSFNLYFKKVLHLKKMPLYMFIDHDLDIYSYFRTEYLLILVYIYLFAIILFVFAVLILLVYRHI